MKKVDDFANKAIQLLQKIITIPSFSGKEDSVADLIEQYLQEEGFLPQRKGNNIWVEKRSETTELPTVLLNSHIDTVLPNASYKRDPFDASIKDGKLFGLGSNDAGAAMVSLMHAFIALKEEKLPYHLIFSATAQEENSGEGGITSILNELGPIDLGIIGEPTLMRMATAEKGLMVLDCTVKGKASHAALNEGENAIYKSMIDIDWIRSFQFLKHSEYLGETKMSVTQIYAGKQHNVIPDVCSFVVDVRINEKYKNKEVLDIIKSHLQSEVVARSTRLNSSQISHSHPAVLRGKELGLQFFGSPTLSDQALLSFTTLKIGPGDSKRSHAADEFIYLHEIDEAIHTYIHFLQGKIV